MKVVVKFEDNDHLYELDFVKLLEELGVPAEDVYTAIDTLIRKS